MPPQVLLRRPPHLPAVLSRTGADQRAAGLRAAALEWLLWIWDRLLRPISTPEHCPECPAPLTQALRKYQSAMSNYLCIRWELWVSLLEQLRTLASCTSKSRRVVGFWSASCRPALSLAARFSWPDAADEAARAGSETVL